MVHANSMMAMVDNEKVAIMYICMYVCLSRADPRSYEENHTEHSLQVIWCFYLKREWKVMDLSWWTKAPFDGSPRHKILWAGHVFRLEDSGILYGEFLDGT